MTNELDKTNQTSFDDFADIKKFMDEYESNPNHTNHSNKDSVDIRDGSIVKGSVCMVNEVHFGWDNFPDKKEDIGHHLAVALDDEENIAWYEKLGRERRSDFLKNCLRIALEAYKSGKVKSIKAKYFAGIIKYRTEAQQRLEAYKERTRKKQEQQNNITVNSPP